MSFLIHVWIAFILSVGGFAKPGDAPSTPEHIPGASDGTGIDIVDIERRAESGGPVFQFGNS